MEVRISELESFRDKLLEYLNVDTLTKTYESCTDQINKTCHGLVAAASRDVKQYADEHTNEAIEENY